MLSQGQNDEWVFPKPAQEKKASLLGYHRDLSQWTPRASGECCGLGVLDHHMQ